MIELRLLSYLPSFGAITMHCATRVRIWACLFAAIVATRAGADVRPHALVSDNMVLQRGVRVPIWGSAEEGEQVTIQFQGQELLTTAKEGKWRVQLENLKPGGP